MKKIKDIVVYTTYAEYHDCFGRIFLVTRMALHPMDDAPCDINYKDQCWDFRVVFRTEKSDVWCYSCLGKDVGLIAGNKVYGIGTDYEAIKWLLEGEE